MRIKVLIVILLGAFSLPLTSYAQTSPTPDESSGKTFRSIPPVKAQLKINSKTGQKQTCETTSSSNPIDIRSEINDKFGILFRGNWSASYLAAACNTFAEISGTRFFELLAGDGSKGPVPVNATSCGDSHVEGNRLVFTNDCGNATLNKVVLLHEIGHVLYYNVNEARRKVEDARAADRGKPYVNGGFTRYGDNPDPCVGGGSGGEIKEDFAESTTYYFNPGATEQTTKGCSSGRVPGADKGSAHYQMMNAILGDF